jgi:hypothetical protein
MTSEQRRWLRECGLPDLWRIQRTAGTQEGGALHYAAAGKMRRSVPDRRAERTQRGAGTASFCGSWWGGWSTTVVSVRRLIVLALSGTALVGSLSEPFPTFAQPITRQEGSAPPSSRLIPIPEIAQRAEDMASLLRQSTERVGVSRDVRDVEGGLAAASEWIRKRLLRTTRVLASASSPDTLTNLAESWQLMRSQLANWNVTLTGNERQLERGIEQLDGIRTTWSATRTAAVGSSVPASLLERIDETLLAIVTARQRVGEERASVLASRSASSRRSPAATTSSRRSSRHGANRSDRFSPATARRSGDPRRSRWGGATWVRACGRRSGTPSS